MDKFTLGGIVGVALCLYGLYLGLVQGNFLGYIIAIIGATVLRYASKSEKKRLSKEAEYPHCPNCGARFPYTFNEIYERSRFNILQCPKCGKPFTP